MSLEHLIAVVPPPDQPIKVDQPERWPIIQQELGIELPADYLEYALRYGSGDFGDPLWLRVWNPLSPNFVPWVVGCLKSLNAYNRIIADGGVPPRRLGGPEGGVLDLFPTRPGFLPIGGNDIGDRLGWWTAGAPDEWPVVFFERCADYAQAFPMSLTTFLTRLHSEPWRTEMGPFWNPEQEPRPEFPEFRPNAFTC